LLLGTVDDVQFEHIADIGSAREIWATLKRIHNAPSRHRPASLLRLFYGFDAGTKTVDEGASFLISLQVDIRNI
jgi:hypothetical protein